MILPGMTLALYFLASYARLTRTAMIEVAEPGFRQDRARQGHHRTRRWRGAISCAMP